jgi:uridine phosphorylase
MYKGKRLSVISTGIGPDNIDIVLNELDALVNIDLKTRQPKTNLTVLNIVRIGTSGSLQVDIPVDSFLMSSHALDLNGMLHSYQIKGISNPEIEDAFVRHTSWSAQKAHPILIENNSVLAQKLMSEKIVTGITATAGGFYGPQGRVLRLPLADANMNAKIDSFTFNGNRITNLEMETSAIYGLSKLLGHRAVSMNAIIANRANGTFSEDYRKVVEDLIEYSLNKLIE